MSNILALEADTKSLISDLNTLKTVFSTKTDDQLKREYQVADITTIYTKAQQTLQQTSASIRAEHKKLDTLNVTTMKKWVAILEGNELAQKTIKEIETIAKAKIGQLEERKGCLPRLKHWLCAPKHFFHRSYYRMVDGINDLAAQTKATAKAALAALRLKTIQAGILVAGCGVLAQSEKLKLSGFTLIASAYLVPKAADVALDALSTSAKIFTLCKAKLTNPVVQTPTTVQTQ